MSVVSLGTRITKGNKDKRPLIDEYGQPKMLHSLESCNFLVLDPQNHIHFKCNHGPNHVISIMQEYYKNYDK